MNFSERIKKLRKEKNLTQEQFANELSVTRQAVSNWENDKNLPDIETIIQIAFIFGVSLDELILGGNEENSMTKKLINDGSENKRTRMNMITTLIGAFIMFFGAMCFIIKSNSVEYIDEYGILHENFYLIPIGYLMCFVGFVVIVSNIIYVKRRRSIN